MLNAGADAMQLRLDAICSIGLATFDGGSRRSRMLTKIITDCPMLLTDTDPEILQQFIDVISDFFGRSNVSDVFECRNNIWVDFRQSKRCSNVRKCYYCMWTM
jgi:hypothetical protein